MHPVLALGLVAVAGIAVTRLPRPAPPPLILDLLRPAGTALVLLGLLLGPGIGLLDRGLLGAAAPLIALALGTIGAGLGSRIDRRLVHRLHPPVVGLALLQAAAAFTVTAAGVWLLTAWRPALAAALVPRLPTGLALAAMAAVSGPGVVPLLTAGTSTRWAFISTLDVAAILDTGLGVLLFAMTLALFPPLADTGGGAQFGPVTWVLLAIGSGVLIGLLFLSLTRLRHTSLELALSLGGCLLLGSGVGYAAGLTSFVVCAVAGATIAGLSPHRGEVVALLQAVERPATAVLFVAAGALLTLPTWWILPAALGLAVARIGARWAAVWVARPILGLAELPPNAGLAGLAQGGVAIALGMSFFQVYDGPVLTVVVIAVALAQLAAPVALTRATGHPEVTA